MAEFVGIVASSAGIASLGCQVIKSVCKLQQILTAIQDVPQELKTILEEITIVTNVLIQCAEYPCLPKDGSHHAMVRDQAVAHCETACKRLLAVVSELEVGVRGSKCRSRWYGVLTVLKAKRLADLTARLERAKSTLALAQLIHLQSLGVEILDRRDHTSSQPALKSPKCLSSSAAIRRSGSNDLHPSYSETSFYLGIGVLVLRRKMSCGGANLSLMKVASIQFRFADWFLRWGLRIAISREFGHFNVTIIPHRLVPANSAIFQACALGDEQAVTRLIQEGKASPFDMTSEGVTPLHVAAAWLHPGTSKQLLEYGADSSVSIQYRHILWNSLGLAVERAGYYRTFIFPGLEEYRPQPEDGLVRMRETMRVLTENDRTDVHQGYNPSEIGYWNGSRSALHGFRGSSEDFLWLFKRENALMAAQDSDDYIASIVLEQTQMFPNDSFPAAFNQISDLNSLAKFKNSAGSSLLHYLLDTNCGKEPGFWINGLDIFVFVRILLEHGADPTACNAKGNTPLMEAARGIRRYFWSKSLYWTAEAATEIYSGFLTRWVKTLESCHVDVEKYCSREIELGAGTFRSCRLYEDLDDVRSNESQQLFVRLEFEQGDSHKQIQIKFRFQSMDKSKIMPGAWPNELVDLA